MKFKIGDRVRTKAGTRYDYQTGEQIIKHLERYRGYLYWTNRGFGYNACDLELIEKRKIEPYKVAKFLNSLNKGE